MSRLSRPALPTVGVFDSGVGGLSVLRRMLDVPTPPWSRIVYLADLEHFPYGPRPTNEVRRLALAGVDVLAGHGADVVAIACNTASSSGVGARTTGTPVPLLDIIGPGARLVAALAGGPGRVLVLGTEGTVRNRVWERALREAGFTGPVLGWPCPFLANLIEEGRNGVVARRAVFEATQGLAAVIGSGPGAASAAGTAGAGGAPASGPADTVILGCTHYPFAAQAIKEVLEGEVLGRLVRTIDPAGALTRELVAWLEKSRGRAEGEPRAAAEKAPEVVLLTTGRAAHFGERARQLLADKLTGDRNGLRLGEVMEVALPDPPA